MARFNSEEVARLDSLRKPFGFSRAKFMRSRALGEALPKMVKIPELNVSAWVALSRSASNLNQIAHKLNMGKNVGIEEIRLELGNFRRSLIGAAKSSGPPEE